MEQSLWGRGPVIGFVIKRLLYNIPVLLGVALITMLLFNVASGDPVSIKLGKAAKESQRKALAKQMGLDKPLVAQYGDFLVQTVTLDFGESWNDNTPVRKIFLRGVGPTLSLSIPAFFTGAILSIALALLVAYHRGGWLDRFMTMAAIAGISISSLVYILVLQWLLADQLKLFPIWGYEYGWGALRFIALPLLIWVLLSVGQDLRYFRTVALEEIGRDYVRTARSKGLSENRILFKHVLRNCSIPIITRLVITVPFLITGSFLLEIFFGIPGLGSTLYTAIQNSDFPVIKAFTMLGTVMFVLFNILSDVLYAYFDPRIRLS